LAEEESRKLNGYWVQDGSDFVGGMNFGGAITSWNPITYVLSISLGGKTWPASLLFFISPQNTDTICFCYEKLADVFPIV
jgi:hypothetical protein